jgi:hypothetical protein
MVEKNTNSIQQRAYLPHPFLQSCLFSLNRKLVRSVRGRQMFIQRRTNKFGDTVEIYSPFPLLVRPDMGIFLAVIALFQKKIRTVNVDDFATEGIKNNPLGHYGADINLSDVYDLTGIVSNHHNRLIESLRCMAWTSLKFTFADAEEHEGLKNFEVSGLWSYNLLTRKGRRGSILQLFPCDILLPWDHYLYADACICNKLKNDTARSIFWSLICREHVRANLEQLQLLTGCTRQRKDKWKNNQLEPALEELQNYGYKVIKNDDETYSINRPNTTTRDHKCHQSGTSG